MFAAVHPSTCGFAVLVALLGWAEVSAAAPPDAPGQALYQRECAACHGAQGDGNGPGAHLLSQKPRNFQLGVFKLRSTPSGENPTDRDLFETITRGVAGANGAMMPSFGALPERARWSLVEVVKEFAGIENPGASIEIPARPTPDLTLGGDVYAALDCGSCHGASGHGDGESSLTLEDDLEERVWAPDLTRGRYKGGSAPEDIYTRIVTGLDGSPMPAYADKATADELWALTEYVMSLARKADRHDEPSAFTPTNRLAGPDGPCSTLLSLALAVAVTTPSEFDRRGCGR